MINYGVAGDQLRAFVERVERLREERKAIDDDIKEVFSEAKGSGFSVPAIKHILKVRAEDQNERAEFEAVVDMYMAALGMIEAEAPLAQVRVHAREESAAIPAKDWQSPRQACFSELRDAYRAGKPISQDFRFENASVYFFAFPEIGRVKIGVSNNVTQRLADLAGQQGCTGTVLHVIAGNRKAEMSAHAAFQEWQVEGEWFRDCADLRKAIGSFVAAHAQVREAAE